MSNFSGWESLYQELAEKLQTIPAITWIDLWHNQVGFMVEEHPFPVPAVFIALRMVNADDLGEQVQDANIQVDLYYFYETFADTFKGSYNQESALDYLKTITDIHKLLHGTTADNWSEMRRIGFSFVDTGSAGNLYKISFSCKVIDSTAMKEWDNIVPGDLSIGAGRTPYEQNEDFIIPGM